MDVLFCFVYAMAEDGGFNWFQTGLIQQGWSEFSKCIAQPAALNYG